MAWRQNATFGRVKMESPMQLRQYTVATAPDASKYPESMIYVSNGAAGSPILAYSDGTDWLRSDTGGAISVV